MKKKNSRPRSISNPQWNYTKLEVTRMRNLEVVWLLFLKTFFLFLKTRRTWKIDKIHLVLCVFYYEKLMKQNDVFWLFKNYLNNSFQKQEPSIPLNTWSGVLRNFIYIRPYHNVGISRKINKKHNGLEYPFSLLE